LRIVVYAEGATDDGGASVAPRAVIPEASLGAAHVLIRRLVSSALNTEEITMVAGLTLGPRRPVGSDFLRAKNIRALTTYASPTDRPDLTVFLLDGDQDAARLTEMRERIGQATPAALPCVVGVAEPELEAWLLADPDAVRQVLGVEFDGLKAGRNLERREAKRSLRQLAAAANTDDSIRHIASRLARATSLETLQRERSFEQLRKDIANAFAGTPLREE
jgi:hypothetical protein